MGCGTSKPLTKEEIAAMKKEKKAKEKEKRAAAAAAVATPIAPLQRKYSVESDGFVMQERTGMGRTWQMARATMKASISDTLKDLRFGKADENADSQELSVKDKKKIMDWLLKLDKTPEPIVETTEDEMGSAGENLEGRAADYRPEEEKPGTKKTVDAGDLQSEGTQWGDPEEVLSCSGSQKDGTNLTIPQRLSTTAKLKEYQAQLMRSLKSKTEKESDVVPLFNVPQDDRISNNSSNKKAFAMSPRGDL
eukprot:PhF_6_TR25415/c0_g1_i1/m.35131